MYHIASAVQFTLLQSPYKEYKTKGHNKSRGPTIAEILYALPEITGWLHKLSYFLTMKVIPTQLIDF